MTQLAIGVSALNHDSQFVAAYEEGISKNEYWIHALEDSLNLIAKLPALAARIYSNVYRDGAAVPAINKEADVVGKHHASLRFFPIEAHFSA
jgi:citrate synthase